ncbi:MAG: hypothetical protein ACLPT4_03260 [Verrucomicrobiia bacterium]
MRWLLAMLIAYRMGGNAVIIGCGTVAIYPMLAFVEGAIYRGSHNLLPIELIAYALWSFPPIGGALLGLLIKKYFHGQEKI